MLNRDDPKSKEDGSSSVGGDETAVVEANPSGIDKSVARTDESPEIEMAKKMQRSKRRRKREGSRDGGEKVKEAGDDETALALVVRANGTESHAGLLLAFEAIPSLRNHYRKCDWCSPHCQRMCKMEYKRKSGTKAFSLNAMSDKLGTDTKDIESILVAKIAEKELLQAIGMDKERCWADDSDDAAVDSWSKILEKGSTPVFFEERFRIDCEARIAKLNGPTNPIGGPSNNAQYEAHEDSVEDTGHEALKAMDGRLMKAVKDAVKVAVKDAVKELNKTISSLSDKVTLLEDEVKSLRSSGENQSEENKESDEEDDVDKASEEEDGGDKETKESEEEDDVNNYIRDVTNEVQEEYGTMDEDDAQMIADAEKHEKEEAEKAKKKKKRPQKAKGLGSEDSVLQKGAKKAAKKAAAEKEAAGEKKKKKQ
ncbi:hypothetical protein Bca52824_023870 [Brassica carinata]|uniref:DUF287 domain-containing protein n=1 Tax=Brassica carinata TaxID=52824 RepID=A0A8X7VJK2_BRACI|nr:hypothetical protein Bca52824_023870 [Brassica carinata]